MSSHKITQYENIMTNQQANDLQMAIQQQTRRELVSSNLDTTAKDTMMISTPTEVDVLCGRGKTCFHHEGNDQFRILIAEHADTYQMATTKKAKMQVVMLIVDIVVARGGRFLIKGENGQTWIDGGQKQGKKKTGHAFRDALRGRVKCITQMRKQNAYRAMLSATDDSSHSSSSYGESSDELDWDSSDDFNPTPMRPNFNIEPSNDWKTSKIDSGMANDLLDFFIAEQLEVDDFSDYGTL